MLFTPFFRRRGTVSCPLDTGRPRRKAGRRSHGNKSLHSRHLKVEPLEQRALLAVVAWDGGGDGISWTDPSNWDTGYVPMGGDDVVIPDLDGDITVSLSTAGTRTINSLDCKETLVVSGGGSLNVSGTTSNSGTLAVQSGTVALAGGGNSSGAFIVDVDARLQFLGDHILDVDSSISGAGEFHMWSGTAEIGGTYNVTGLTTIGEWAGEVNFTGEVLSVGAKLSLYGYADVDFHGTSITTNELYMQGTNLPSGDVTVSKLIWKTGTMTGTGTTTVADELTMDHGHVSLDGRTLRNEGTATVLRNMALANGAVFDNYGIFDVPGDASQAVTGNGTFNNYGTFQRSAGTGVSDLTSGVVFNNSGTLDLQGGILYLRGGGTSSGQFSVAAGAQLWFFSGTHLLDADSIVEGAGTVYFGSSWGPVDATVDGTVSPGFDTHYTRTLTFNGGYPLSSTGSLDIEIGENGHDQLDVVGGVTLDGALDVSTLGGFVAAFGDTFTILNNDGTDPIVDTFNGLAEGGLLTADGQQFEISYVGGDGNDVVLTAVNRPPVAEDQSVVGNEDTPLDVLLTASDPDEDPLTYEIVAQPAHGTLSGTAPELTYTPSANYNGPDSFSYKVSDGTFESNVATVSITIDPVNDAPVISPITLEVAEDGSVEIDLRTLVEDVETGDDDLVFTVDDATGGTAVLLADGHTARFEAGIGCGGMASGSFAFSVTDTGDNGAGPITVGPVTIDVDILPAVAEGNVTIDADGIVRVGGTAGDDDILVTHTADALNLEVTVNGTVHNSIALADVAEVRVWSRAGNDRAELIDLTITSMLDGGVGDDELIGAAGSDLIFGSLGNDKLTGGSGNDFLIGGDGSDRIVGSAGHDILVAGGVACSFTEEDFRAALADWIYGREDDDGTVDDVLDETLITDEDRDMLTGSSGADLFIINDGDKITDLNKALKDGDEIRIVGS